MLGLEQAAWDKGKRRVAGADEAGRGPLAGPVTAAAVCFERDFLVAEQHGLLAEINDSKQLSAQARDRLYAILTRSAHTAYAAVSLEPEDIDRLNILRASQEAIRRALQRLPRAPDWVLVDGRPIPDLPFPAECVVKGDTLSLSIAAASIIAKVTRDLQMLELDETYPGYGFAEHKGYPTPQHLEALRRLGPSPIHRRSFGPVRDQIQHQGGTGPFVSPGYGIRDTGYGIRDAGYGIRDTGYIIVLGFGVQCSATSNRYSHGHAGRVILPACSCGTRNPNPTASDDGVNGKRKRPCAARA